MFSPTKLPWHATEIVIACRVQTTQEQDIDSKSKYQHQYLLQIHKSVFNNFMGCINLDKGFLRQFTFKSETIFKVLLSREYILEITTQSSTSVQNSTTAPFTMLQTLFLMDKCRPILHYANFQNIKCISKGKQNMFLQKTRHSYCIAIF